MSTFGNIVLIITKIPFKIIYINIQQIIIIPNQPLKRNH